MSAKQHERDVTSPFCFSRPGVLFPLGGGDEKLTGDIRNRIQQQLQPAHGGSLLQSRIQLFQLLHHRPTCVLDIFNRAAS
jgi:hypothetical protein